MTLFIIPCSATKSRLLISGNDLPAREAYMGQAFRFARNSVERKGYSYFILSAYYGLLQPGTVISNYNVKMTPLKPTDQWDEAFANITDKELRELRTADRVVCLGSRLYADAAAVLLGRPVEAPVAGLPIGRMLNALRGELWDKLPVQWKEAA